MNNKQYLKFIKDKNRRLEKLIEKKNHDYSGGNTNPFFNIERCERNGRCSTEMGVLTRMDDKMARLDSLLTRVKGRVKGETVQDTLDDIIGYSLMLSAYLKAKKK